MFIFIDPLRVFREQSSEEKGNNLVIPTGSTHPSALFLLLFIYLLNTLVQSFLQISHYTIILFYTLWFTRSGLLPQRTSPPRRHPVWPTGRLNLKWASNQVYITVACKRKGLWWEQWNFNPHTFHVLFQRSCSWGDAEECCMSKHCSHHYTWPISPYYVPVLSLSFNHGVN